MRYLHPNNMVEPFWYFHQLRELVNPTCMYQIRLRYLSLKLRLWQNKQRLPYMCAFEQLHDCKLTNEQVKWLLQFNKDWDEAQNIT